MDADILSIHDKISQHSEELIPTNKLDAKISKGEVYLADRTESGPARVSNRDRPMT